MPWPSAPKISTKRAGNTTSYNDSPARGPDGRMGLIFYRTLAQDFLLQPPLRLYFAQDLAFFVRAVLAAQADALPQAAPSQDKETHA